MIRYKILRKFENTKRVVVINSRFRISQRLDFERHFIVTFHKKQLYYYFVNALVTLGHVCCIAGM